MLGAVWSVTLDCSPTGSGLAVLEVRFAATSGSLTPFGEVLVDGALVERSYRAYSDAPSVFAWPVPDDVALCGLELHVQGLCRTSAPTAWKARASRGVLTNAVDLVLGF